MLFDKLWTYSNSAEAAAIQQGYEVAVAELWEAAQETAAQCFAVLATWSLDMWEAYLALPSGSGVSDSVRRERIVSKLRGAGVSTRELVERVAESYYNGNVDVTEQFGDYTFTVTFTSTRGQPPGLSQLQAAIEDVKPAHLGVVYVFLYTTHGELSTLTHSALHAYTHAELRSLMT